MSNEIVVAVTLGALIFMVSIEGALIVWAMSMLRDHAVQLGMHRTQLRTINGERKERLTAALVNRRPQPVTPPVAVAPHDDDADAPGDDDTDRVSW